MNHWLALYCPPCVTKPVEGEARKAASVAPQAADALAVAHWALQFTPRVALLEEAVVLEVQASLRLFGGARALRRRLGPEARLLGVQRMAWAPTSLAALALARALQPDGFAAPLHELLDRLPISTVTAVAHQEAMLSRLGCRTLGEVRALPRAGTSRRFGKALLEAMDHAYGLQPETHAWVTLPEVFEASLELPGRVENAPALLFAAQRLLVCLGAWLTARHVGVTRFTLSWQHDFHRRDAGPGGLLTLRTMEPTRHVEHIRALLAEHLARTELSGPVGALALRADEVQPLADATSALWPHQSLPGGEQAIGDAQRRLGELLERLSARLGGEHVSRPLMRLDHRPEAMQSWVPAMLPLPARGIRASPAGGGNEQPISSGAQPGWILPEPLPLQVRGNRPMRLGPLDLLAGPQRVENGWWHERPDPAKLEPSASSLTLRVQRDYYVAYNSRAGLLWVFEERPGRKPSMQSTQSPGEQAASSAWFLHGVFA